MILTLAFDGLADPATEPRPYVPGNPFGLQVASDATASVLVVYDVDTDQPILTIFDEREVVESAAAWLADTCPECMGCLTYKDIDFDSRTYDLGALLGNSILVQLGLRQDEMYEVKLLRSKGRYSVSLLSLVYGNEIAREDDLAFDAAAVAAGFVYGYDPDCIRISPRTSPHEFADPLALDRGARIGRELLRAQGLNLSLLKAA